MNMALLEDKIDQSGYKREFIAEQLGLSRHGLYNKMKNPDRWKVTEMTVLVKLLALSKSESRQIFED